MRPSPAPEGVPDGPVRVEFQVQFSRGPKGRRRVRGAREAQNPRDATPVRPVIADAAPKPAPLDPNCVPRITRLLVLGHHFERLVRDGVVKNYAEIARLAGLSRARVTQICNLTLIAPDSQEEILLLASARADLRPNYEGGLRSVGLVDGWVAQNRLRECLKGLILPTLPSSKLLGRGPRMNGDVPPARPSSG